MGNEMREKIAREAYQHRRKRDGYPPDPMDYAFADRILALVKPVGVEEVLDLSSPFAALGGTDDR